MNRRNEENKRVERRECGGKLKPPSKTGQTGHYDNDHETDGYWKV